MSVDTSPAASEPAPAVRPTQLAVGADSDAERLTHLEAVVDQGLATFVEVGRALLEIRDSRLYRDTHPTFESYCSERFGLQRQRAYELIQAAQVTAAVSEISDTLPARESHAAELAPLRGRPQELREAWTEVVDLHPEPTAADVREVVQRKLSTTATLGSSESDEWYTPATYIEAARFVMGDIDLDPASCVAANSIILAREFFTIDDDGLAKDWHGRVFMNPPFGRDGSPAFVAKLLAEYTAGRVECAIILCAARLETQWFQPLFDHTLCFPNHRVRFWQPGRTPAPPFTPAFAYLGPAPDAFARGFKKFGPVVERFHR